MSHTHDINLGTLYSIVSSESESDTLHELEPNFYLKVSEFIGKLKLEEYDNTEAKIKNELVKALSQLIELLLKIRLEKILASKQDFANILDEEKFILDSENEKNERKELILLGILNGKSKLLESISKKHKTKLITVRFLKELDQIIGVDMEKYGPFQAEDIATIPYENAQALIANNIAIKIRWEY